MINLNFIEVEIHAEKIDFDSDGKCRSLYLKLRSQQYSDVHQIAMSDKSAKSPGKSAYWAFSSAIRKKSVGNSVSHL